MLVSPVQEYVRLIGPWCQVNIGSCRFVLAQSYLANGESQKVCERRAAHLTCVQPHLTFCDITSCCLHQALQCFQEAASEVEREEFLMKLTAGEDEEAPSSPRLQYYNKVRMLRCLCGCSSPV